MERRSSFMRGLDVTAIVLLVIGGLNWGLIGLFDFNIVSAIFGVGSTISRFIYSLVGLAAIYEVFQWRSVQHRWSCETWPRPAGRTAV